MPNNPNIDFPDDGESITLIDGSRMFVAQGRLKLVGDASLAGLNGHLVLPGTETVKAVGSLLGLSRPGRGNQTDYFWSVLFELGDLGTVPDGDYDLIISTYLGSDNLKTAQEVKSSAKSDEIELTTADVAGLNITYPTNGIQINGGQFVAYGSFSAGDKPNRATMTEIASGVVYSAGTLFTNGNQSGYWYAAFAPLLGGTYALDVAAPGATRQVTGLIV